MRTTVPLRILPITFQQDTTILPMTLAWLSHEGSESVLGTNSLETQSLFHDCRQYESFPDAEPSPRLSVRPEQRTGWLLH